MRTFLFLRRNETVTSWSTSRARMKWKIFFFSVQSEAYRIRERKAKAEEHITLVCTSDNVDSATESLSIASARSAEKFMKIYLGFLGRYFLLFFTFSQTPKMDPLIKLTSNSSAEANFAISHLNVFVSDFISFINQFL